MLLAELNADYGSQATSLLPWPISTLIILAGLFLASFPDDNSGWIPWSRTIDSIARSVIPAGGELNRYVVSLGTEIFVFGVFFSRDARRLLSHPVMNFLGRISFPIYLLHDTLIRTILSWMVYRQSIVEKGLHPVDDEGNPTWFERGGSLTFVIAIPVFYIILVYTAYLWTIHVDPRCEKFVDWMSRKAFGDTDDSDLTKEGSLDGILKI